MKLKILLSPCLLLLAAAACGEHPQDETADPLTFAALPSGPECVDPPEVAVPIDELPLAADLPDIEIEEGPSGPFVDFTPPVRRTFTAKVIVSLDADDDTRTRSTLTQKVAALDVQVQRAALRTRTSSNRVTLSTGGRAIGDLDLEVTYSFDARKTGVSSLALIDRGTQAPVDTFDPALVFTDVPANCKEEALLVFGPFPQGMPAVKFPEINGCSEERCTDLALAWLHTHHNVWRAQQMFEVMQAVHPEQRLYAWDRPGTNAEGEAVTIESSPAYWLGAYGSERYNAFREGVNDFGAIMRNAKIGSTKVRLQCPNQQTNPGNVCFTTKPSAHHWVRGYINFCDKAFNTQSHVNNLMHHEPLHHVFVSYNGPKMLRDNFVHGHGSLCLSDLQDGPVYGETEIRHFVTQGNKCLHDNNLVIMVDAYAEFIERVGELVLDGHMTHWPKWGDPTPQPPQCVGDVGCLCEDTQDYYEPDGDYAIDRYCDDSEGLTVCKKTKFNASDTVGICTLCDEHRGPGCPCDDLTDPCDEGFCFGDDTGGESAGTGTCYQAEPPYWACLADCERLLGNGAFCMYDHPDGGRCVPYGTSLPEAYNCWIDGGHMDPQELECTFAEECITSNDCFELGYPTYFACDQSLRCVPNL